MFKEVAKSLPPTLKREYHKIRVTKYEAKLIIQHRFNEACYNHPKKWSELLLNNIRLLQKMKVPYPEYNKVFLDCPLIS